MKIVLADVSVLFDLYKIQALDYFFDLGLEVFTTKFVYREILYSGQKERFEDYKNSGHLKILDFNDAEVKEITELTLTPRIHSMGDKSIFYKTIQLKGMLLTADSKLRKVAEKVGIEVHGSIWVIDELLSKKIISNSKGIELFEAMLASNQTLPRSELKRRIENLEENDRG